VQLEVARVTLHTFLDKLHAAQISHMVNRPVIRSFRELCRLISRLPTDAERRAASEQARSEMRKNSAACAEEVADLHRVLVSKISFLRMKVPKLARDAGKVGTGRYVVRDGEVVEGTAKSSGTRCASLETRSP
jgi:hypothetical protein